MQAIQLGIREIITTLKDAGKLAILIVSTACSIAAYADGLFTLADESGCLPLGAMQDSQDSLDEVLVDSDGDLNYTQCSNHRAGSWERRAVPRTGDEY